MWSPRSISFAALLLLSREAATQIDGAGGQYISETLSLDPQAIQGLIRTGNAQGKNVRWLTLGQKTLKYDLTIQQTEAKRRERDMQRTQLARLADGLRQTKELFAKYYEQFSVVSNAAQTVAGFLEIGQRVRSIIELIDQLRLEFVRMDQFTDEERDLIRRVLTATIERTQRVVKASKFALMGDNTSPEELAALRAEHGNFMVTLRSIDRTDQLELIDREIVSIIHDLQGLVGLLSNLQNNRERDKVSQTEALRRLLSGN